MEFEEFEKMIKENSKKGVSTEFMKRNNTIDDYRKSRPVDYETLERILAKYMKDERTFEIIYPDKDRVEVLSKSELEDKFYRDYWNAMIHT